VSDDSTGDQASARRSGAKVLPAKVRHLLNRITYGIPLDLAKTVRRDGVEAWLDQQLEPETIDDGKADEMVSWFPVLTMTPGDLWRASVRGELNVPGWSTDFQRWVMLRRMVSQRQVLERMADFWSDLLYIQVPEGKSWVHRFDYDATIRRHALGRFDDLLVAAETHPAMGCYLDNAGSTKTNPNENLGRELLELHTVGREAKFSEAEVLDSARILTGYRVRMYDTWEAYYEPRDHYVGAVSVLGFTSPNADPDGRAVTEAYIRHLAHLPATAQRVAKRMCVYLVQDSPPQELVDAVAETFLSSGTDIKATVRTLVNHPAFSAAVDGKIRTPVEDMIATYRVLRLKPLRPTVPGDLANVMVWHAAAIGQRPFDWPRPDGPPDAGDAWSAVGRALGSWRMHYTVAANDVTVTGMTLPPTSSWLPEMPATVGEVIDHVSRLLLARPATPTVLQSAGRRMNLELSREVQTVEDWRVRQLLAALLDTPAHMFR
jgi:hypothetical protein